MARSISTIQQQIIDAVEADPILGTELTSTSKRAIWRLWTFIIATAISLLEQLIDLFKVEVETIVSKAAPGSPQWLQDQVFKFQYDDNNPQILQLIDLVPQYPVVDENLRIITRCSVTTDIANNVTVKVAKGTTPGPLSGPELSALTSYVRIKGVAGITYNPISSESDKLFVEAQVYYNGLFSAVIKANVITAIDTFLAGIPFNGVVKVSDLERAILAVDGVTDIVLNNVMARADATAQMAGTFLVVNNTLASRTWPTLAGYIIAETGTYAPANYLTFISQ